jgi:hypothetical protein
MLSCVTNPVEPLANRPTAPDVAVVYFRITITDVPSAIYPTKRLWLLVDHHVDDTESKYFFWFAGMPGIEVPNEWEIVNSVKTADSLVAAQVKPGELHLDVLYVFLDETTSATYGGTQTITTSLQLPIDYSFSVDPGSINYLGHIVLELLSFEDGRFSYNSQIVPGDAARDEQEFRAMYPEFFSSVDDSESIVIHTPPGRTASGSDRK